MAKGINTLISEMKYEYMNNIHPSTPKSTADAIVRTATKQVLRGTKADSWKGPKEKANAETAKRVSESLDAPNNKTDGFVDAKKMGQTTGRRAKVGGYKQRTHTNRSTGMQSTQMTQHHTSIGEANEAKRLKALKDIPKCPPGYHYKSSEKQCVPNTAKDDVRVNGGGRDSSPENSAGYNTWGATGVNGDGYAWAEPNNWGGGSDAPVAVPFNEAKKSCVRCGSSKCRCIKPGTPEYRELMK